MFNLSKFLRLAGVIGGGFVIAVLYANCNKNDGSNNAKSHWPGQDADKVNLVVAMPSAASNSNASSAGRLPLTDYVRRWLWGSMSDSQWDEGNFKLVSAPIGVEVYPDDLPTTDKNKAGKAGAEFDELFVKIKAGFTGVAKVQLKRPANSTKIKTLNLVVQKTVTHSTGDQNAYKISGPSAVMAGEKALFVLSTSDGSKGSFSGSFGVEQQGGLKGVYPKKGSCCDGGDSAGTCARLIKKRPTGISTETEAVDFCLGLPEVKGWEWDELPSNLVGNVEKATADRYYSKDKSIPLPHHAFVHVYEADAGMGFDVALRKTPYESDSKDVVLRNIRIHQDLTSKYQVSVQREMCSNTLGETECEAVGGRYGDNSCTCDGTRRGALVLTWPCPSEKNAMLIKAEGEGAEKCKEAVALDSDELTDSSFVNFVVKQCKVGSHNDNPTCLTDNTAGWKTPFNEDNGWNKYTQSPSDKNAGDMKEANKARIYIGRTHKHSSYFTRYRHDVHTDNSDDRVRTEGTAPESPDVALSAEGSYMSAVLPLTLFDTYRGKKYKYLVEFKKKSSEETKVQQLLSCTGMSASWSARHPSCIEDQIVFKKSEPTNVKIKVAREGTTSRGAIKLSWQGATSVTLSQKQPESSTSRINVPHSYKIQMCQTDDADDDCGADGEAWANLANVGSNSACSMATHIVDPAALEGRPVSPETTALGLVGVRGSSGSDSSYIDDSGGNGKFFSCVIAVDAGATETTPDDDGLDQNKFYRFRIYDANKVGSNPDAAGTGESSAWVYATTGDATTSDNSNGDALRPGFAGEGATISNLKVKKITEGTSNKIQLSWDCPAAAHRDWTCTGADASDNINKQPAHTTTNSPEDARKFANVIGADEDPEVDKVAKYEIKRCKIITTGSNTVDCTAMEDFNNLVSYKVETSGGKVMFKDIVGADGVFGSINNQGVFSPADDTHNLASAEKYVYQIHVFNELGIRSSNKKTCASITGDLDNTNKICRSTGDGIGL